MASMADEIRVPKAAELVASALRRQIVSGELKEEDTLPSEAMLMQQFRVSRPTLREAFRLLESESLIEVRRGARGGARVHVPNGDVAARYAGYVLEYRNVTMADVYTARMELEVPLARLLAVKAKAKDVALLRAAVEAAEPYLDDAEAYAEHDVDFHLLVADLAGNQTLKLLDEMLYHMVRTARRRYATVLNRKDLLVEYSQVHRTHSKFVDLIDKRDPEEAEDLWRSHLLEANKHYLARPIAKSVVEMME